MPTWGATRAPGTAGELPGGRRAQVRVEEVGSRVTSPARVPARPPGQLAPLPAGKPASRLGPEPHPPGPASAPAGRAGCPAQCPERLAPESLACLHTSALPARSTAWLRSGRRESQSWTRAELRAGSGRCGRKERGLWTASSQTLRPEGKRFLRDKEPQCTLDVSRGNFTHLGVWARSYLPPSWQLRRAVPASGRLALHTLPRCCPGSQACGARPAEQIF